MRRTALVNTLGILALGFVLLGVYAGGAGAQTLPTPGADDQLGLQPYQSYDFGNIDVIGLSSGTVSLDLPFLSYPQRGSLKFSFNLIYSNEPQHVGLFKAGGQTYQEWGYVANPVPLPVEKGDVQVAWAQNNAVQQVQVENITYTDGQPTGYYYYYDFSVVGADGAKHVLGNTGSYTDIYNQNELTHYFQGTGPWRSQDASGWVMNGVMPVLIGNGGGLNSIVGSDGVLYQVPGSGGTVIPEEDPNGNEITQTSTGWSDSIGRAIPTPPRAPLAVVAGTVRQAR
jgi:hypothetical protein